MTTPTFRFAVIGFGRRGRYHMDSLEAMEDPKVRCVAVADPRDPTAEEEERFGPAFYNDYRQMLANTPDLDFALVASYAVDHVEHALAALQQGIPVFLEGNVYNRSSNMAHHNNLSASDSGFEQILVDFENFMGQALTRQLDLHREIDQMLRGGPPSET